MVTAVTALLTPALTALFVVGFDQGIRGWFLASLITGIATLAVAMLVVPWHFGGGLRWSVIRVALIFSLPLIPHSLAHWTLQLADRIVIAGMVSGADLGRYTLAGIVAGSVMMLLIALNQGFAPSYARAGATDDHREALQRVVVVQITAVVTIALAGALMAPPLIEVLTPVDYHGAAELIPWLVLGYGFLGLYFIPMNGAALAAGRTRNAWVATALSAALNIGLLYWLVPDHGVQAAAVASAIGYLTLLLLISLWAHARPNPVRYDWRRIVPVVAAAAVAYVGAQMTAPDSTFGAVTVHLAWLLAFTAAVVALVYRDAGQVVRRAGIA
jgi:O-antigen/teichoic acid export membrane protein